MLEKSQNLVKLDRKETCPFLIRVFYAVNDENDYKTLTDLPKGKEVQLHLWYMNFNIGWTQH